MLVIGLGISGIAVLGLMRYMLTSFRDSMEVEHPTPKTQYIDQKTEDALMPSTLEKLIGSHNKDIQGVASRIVLDRALHDSDTIGGLLWEVTRRDGERRENGLRALHLICGESNQTLTNHHSPLLSSTAGALADTYIPRVTKALVIALKNCALENDYPPYDKDFDSFDFRDPAENVALVTLELLLSERVGATRQLVKTGFVQFWLASQNWGNTQEEKHVNFQHLFQLHGKGCSNPLSHIVNKIAGLQRGVKQLVHAGLIEQPESVDVVGFNKGYSIYAGGGDASNPVAWVYGIPRGGHEDEPSDDITYRLEEVLMEAANNGEGPPGAGGRRPVEQSAEERRLRRRNREVMVLNDGSQPLAMSDIIETI